MLSIKKIEDKAYIARELGNHFPIKEGTLAEKFPNVLQISYRAPVSKLMSDFVKAVIDQEKWEKEKDFFMVNTSFLHGSGERYYGDEPICPPWPTKTAWFMTDTAEKLAKIEQQFQAYVLA